VCEKKGHEDFWDVDADIIRSANSSINTERTTRWKLAEISSRRSYGTTRGAAIADSCNRITTWRSTRVILVSVADDIEAIFGYLTGNDDRPLYLPSVAAGARPDPGADDRADGARTVLDEGAVCLWPSLLRL